MLVFSAVDGQLLGRIRLQLDDLIATQSRSRRRLLRPQSPRTRPQSPSPPLRRTDTGPQALRGHRTRLTPTNLSAGPRRDTSRDRCRSSANRPSCGYHTDDEPSAPETSGVQSQYYARLHPPTDGWTQHSEPPMVSERLDLLPRLCEPPARGTDVHPDASEKAADGRGRPRLRSQHPSSIAGEPMERYS